MPIFKNRPFVRGFLSGLILGWIVLIGVAVLWMNHARSVVTRNLERQQEVNMAADDNLALRISPPVFEVGDYGVFDYGWTPQFVDGRTVGSESYREKVLFVHLWATWCTPCLREIPEIVKLESWVREQSLPVEFLMISTEETDTIRGFLERHPVPLPVVAAHDELPSAVWTNVFPSTFIVDTRGRIVLRHRGATQWSTEESKRFLRDLAEARSSSGDEAEQG